jgi:hypothetical protein
VAQGYLSQPDITGKANQVSGTGCVRTDLNEFLWNEFFRDKMRGGYFFYPGPVLCF